MSPSPPTRGCSASNRRDGVAHPVRRDVAAGLQLVRQAADYARHVFTRYADLGRSPRDTDEPVWARLRRQELMYGRGRRFDILIGETALRS
ncbi:Scr1 family TA system antitoxin-like transcriptional regulator [Streptomyces nigra]